MKNITKKLGILMATLMLGSLFVGCGGNGKKENSDSTPSESVVDEGINNLAENEQLLFSFENYDDMHSVLKATYNRLGVLNFSDEHVTHGKKSLKLDVWGEYDTTDRPGMDLYCTNSDFETGNFSNLDTLKMDVYNAQDKELQIGISFNVTLKSDFTKKGNTPIEFFTLAPNASTTVTYKIPNLVSVCDMEKVNFIHLEFDKAKTSREDPAHTFYIDNLRGVKLESERPVDENANVSYTKGFDFESLAQVMLMPTFDGFDSSWVKYADEGIETPEELGLGEYALKAKNPANKSWPGFVIDFGETFEVGTKITFNTYLSVAAEDYVEGINPNTPFYIEAFSDTGKGYKFTAESDGFALNAWVEVTITVTNQTSGLWFFYNFWNHITNTSVMANANHTVYLDNFKVTPPAKAEE